MFHIISVLCLSIHLSNGKVFSSDFVTFSQKSSAELLSEFPPTNNVLTFMGKSNVTFHLYTRSVVTS